MATGTVKWFNATKGFGFIQPDAGGADVFVHINAVERAGMGDLNEGQKIAYEVVPDKCTGKSSAENLKASLKSANQSRRAPLSILPRWDCSAGAHE
jgi:cold shock protein